jgi:hypothetical protein
VRSNGALTFFIQENLKKIKNPAEKICRVLPHPLLRIEGKGRGETGGRTYGET